MQSYNAIITGKGPILDEKMLGLLFSLAFFGPCELGDQSDLLDPKYHK